MNKTKGAGRVFIDTSGFKALVDPDDEFHAQAVRIWGDLAGKGIALVTSNYILDECYTLIRVRCGVGVVKEFRELLANSGEEIKVMRISLPDELMAWRWFENDRSRLSFTDCVSFALMERLGLTKFFGFDEHFERAGFGKIKSLRKG